jgi:AcrR family transcriptional regulator
MARPSQNIDQILLQSGRELLPHCGCCDLSVRALAEHAKVNVGMFHYHFRSKDNFLTILLQSMYEELFVQLQAEAELTGSALQRLRQTMNLLARLLREHGTWIGRVWSDGARGDTVAQAFLQKNGTRHMQLIAGLIIEAKMNNEIADVVPMQAFTFLMGSIAAPMIFAPRVMAMCGMPNMFHEQMHAEVLSDKGIAARVDRALYALSIPSKDLHHE